MDGFFCRSHTIFLSVFLVLASNFSSAGENECAAVGDHLGKTDFFIGDYISADSNFHHYLAKEWELAKGVLNGSIQYEEKGQKKSMFFNLSAKEGLYTLELRVEPHRTFEYFAAVPCGVALRESGVSRIAFDFVNVRNSNDSTVRIRTMRFVFSGDLKGLQRIEYVSYKEYYKLGRRSSRQKSSFTMKPNLR